jgi:hypothetical protein
MIGVARETLILMTRFFVCKMSEGFTGRASGGKNKAACGRLYDLI